jgi:hypothetical protein
VKVTTNLTGTYHVRILREVFKEGHRLFPKTKDRAEARRQFLKLRFWPQQNIAGPHGELLDLDWEVVEALKEKRVFELRIHDTIGGHDNLRAYFWVAKKRDADEMPCVWILYIQQKKRNQIDQQTIRLIQARLAIVKAVFYAD